MDAARLSATEHALRPAHLVVAGRRRIPRDDHIVTAIHQLFVQNKVSVGFHGHDHFYAKQDLDGVVYQEVLQPGNPGNGKSPRSAAGYGYASGTTLESPGYLRLADTAGRTSVAYLRTQRHDFTIAHAYEVR